MSEERESLDSLCQVVYQKTGLDLSPYKEKFLLRRVAVRIRATDHQDLPGYVEYLGREKDELEKLIFCLTIHVSTFFRNPTTFDAIRAEIFPRLFDSPTDRQVRIWSVGCARGEEPYSLAMLILEHLGENHQEWDVSIDAIDVNARVLEDAKRGEFTENQLKDLNHALAKKYFTKNGGYRLVPEVRDMVRFHRRDILMGAPGADYDFILCRNLLIYIEREPQERILERFHRALRPGGYLVLGRTEALIGPSRALYEVLNAKERIYRKVG